MPQTNEQKRESAKKRQAAYDALTPQQKLDRLDRAFGKDVGAKRERARVLKRMKMVATVVPLSSVPAEIRDPRPTKEERRRMKQEKKS